VRAITKGAEPVSLTTHRAQPHSDYDNYQQMDDLRRSLTDEQHGLCCYCTSRVKADRSAMKVEHWQCQTGFPQRQLAYANLLAACSGGEGKPLRQQHCDSLKGNNSLMWNPADAAHVIESRVEYLADGTIRSPDPAFDAELNAVIGLNQPHLRNNRKGVLDSIKIWWQASARTDNQIRSQIAKFSPAAGTNDPFSPVIVWFLKRKLGI
jgi:uncharacterized protein (TIGR02646 family)